MVIDEYQWFAIHKAEETVQQEFIKLLKEGKTLASSAKQAAPPLQTLDNY